MKKGTYGLTFPQNIFWFFYKICGNSNISMITGLINIEEDFNVDFCKEAFNQLLKHNDAMRINVKKSIGGVYQVITDYEYEDIEVIDFTNISQEEIDNKLQEMAKEAIDLFSPKLYHARILKYSEGRGGVFLGIHHVISDAWSAAKTLEQFVKNYESLKEKGTIEDVEYPSYVDFIKAQEKYANSDKMLLDKKYYFDYLKGYKKPISLKDRNKMLSTETKNYNIKIDKELNDRIVDFCKDKKISPYTLFLVVLGIYIYRTKNISDIVIGSPSLNRSNFAAKQTLGIFMGLIPVRMMLDDDKVIMDLLKSVSTNTMNTFRHQRYPYLNLLADIRKYIKSEIGIYNIVLSYQNARIDLMNEEKYTSKWYTNVNQLEELQIHILDIENTGVLEVNYNYLESLFDREEIEVLHLRLMEIASNIIANAYARVGDINVISQVEKQRLISDVNTKKYEFPKNKSVIDLFEEQVAKTPDNIAIVFENKKVTYKELNERSNVVANYLMESGVRLKDVVSIVMKRNENLIVSILATLKCRATYFVIDSNCLQDRINYMLKNNKSSFVIMDSNKKFGIDDINELNINYDKLEAFSKEDMKENLKIPFIKNNINYLMCTSENIVNFVICMNDVLKITSKEKIVSIANVSSDLFRLELWLPLVNGATIVLANDKECVNIKKLNELCTQNEVTTIQTALTKVKMLLNETTYMYDMEKVLFGKEKIPSDFVNRIEDIIKSPVYDIYGNTI